MRRKSGRVIPWIRSREHRGCDYTVASNRMEFSAHTIRVIMLTAGEERGGRKSELLDQKPVVSHLVFPCLISEAKTQPGSGIVHILGLLTQVIRPCGYWARAGTSGLPVRIEPGVGAEPSFLMPSCLATCSNFALSCLPCLEGVYIRKLKRPNEWRPAGLGLGKQKPPTRGLFTFEARYHHFPHLVQFAVYEVPGTP